MFKSLNNLAPTYLSELFLHSSEVHKLALRDANLTFHSSLMATNASQCRLSYRGTAAWKRMEKQIQGDTLLQTFKAKLIE